MPTVWWAFLQKEEKNMPQKSTDFWLMICFLIVIGAATPVVNAILSPENEKPVTVFARVIRSTIFIMSSLVIYWFDKDAPVWVIVGVGAILSTIGLENILTIATLYIKKRLGVEDKS